VKSHFMSAEVKEWMPVVQGPRDPAAAPKK